MKKISLDEFLRLRKLVHRSARLLDYTKWKLLFENGSCDDFLLVLTSYQNEDGGFGYNIECNNWNPNSSPYTVCIALDYLDTTGDHESDIKKQNHCGYYQISGLRGIFIERRLGGNAGNPQQ